MKDAFLQVCQDDPILVTLQGEQCVINRNLPGQRLGAKQWCLFLKDFLQSSMGFEFSAEQPCLARTAEATILIHVDDILYVGKQDFWRNVFLKCSWPAGGDLERILVMTGTWVAPLRIPSGYLT